MTKNPDQKRMQKYFHLSSQIAQMDHAQLSSVLDNSEPITSWGRHQTLEIDGTNVFVKRIPVTDIEYENMFSTNNLYDLPTYYNYGLGSVGLGVYRELVTLIKTTNWVLSGEIDSFPLLYHYRIIPIGGERAEVDEKKRQGYIKYWGGNENIGRYMLDRANANYELVLFLEHIPHVLQPWLLEHPEEVDWAFDELRVTIDFLKKKGIIHLDAHFYNVLTDAKRVYLTDFGLVLDRAFPLREDEMRFFEAHVDYDHGEILSCLGDMIYEMYEALPEQEQGQLKEKYGLPDNVHALIAGLLHNIEEIHAGGIIKLNETFLDCIIRYRDINILMFDFYSSTRGDNKKTAKFPQIELRRLLNEIGFVSDA